MTASEQDRLRAARDGTGSPVAGTRAEAVFEGHFRAHYAEVLAYALRRLGERGAAEDVASQTFVVAWRRLDAMPADALPWLVGIARHVIQNETRAARRRSRLLARITSALPPAAAPDPAASVAARSAILAAFRRLDERHREVLRLAAWEEMDTRGAAIVLGCSRGAYALRLHRARRRLAKELAASGHSCEADDAVLATETVHEETR
jgi:RNA polymerase sigma factor (sigma-70 family)